MLRHRESIYRRDFRRRLATKESRDEIGRHAAYSCQVGSLGLKPWQVAPCDVQPGWIDAPGFEDRCTAAASALLARLLAAAASLACTASNSAELRMGSCSPR